MNCVLLISLRETIKGGDLLEQPRPREHGEIFEMIVELQARRPTVPLAAQQADA